MCTPPQSPPPPPTLQVGAFLTTGSAEISQGLYLERSRLGMVAGCRQGQFVGRRFGWAHVGVGSGRRRGSECNVPTMFKQFISCSPTHGNDLQPMRASKTSLRHLPPNRLQDVLPIRFQPSASYGRWAATSYVVATQRPLGRRYLVLVFKSIVGGVPCEADASSNK